MAYTHTKVSEIELTTKDRIVRFADEDAGGFSRLLPMVDNIPVGSELAQFCAAIRKANRHVKFGVGPQTPWAWSGSTRFARSLHVYLEGQTYAMMQVGYGDYTCKGRGGDSKYMVHARMIRNEKFADHRDQYYMATAETSERALKNVKKYMRPYSPIECANITLGEVRYKCASVASATSSGENAAKSGVLDGVQARTELFHMLDVGYEFLSEDFREKIAQWREKYDEGRVFRARATHMYYVNVRIQRDDMVCDVVEVLDVDKQYTVSNTATQTTYSMSELPEHIAGNLAALSMVEDEHYVDGVGLRVDSSTFWVQR